MSKATKRKYVMDEVMIQELTLPTENQTIVKIVASKGNNLHEVSGIYCFVTIPDLILFQQRWFTGHDICDLESLHTIYLPSYTLYSSIIKQNYPNYPKLAVITSHGHKEE